MTIMRRCLIVGPSWVGDMIMAQCLFQAIKAHEPDLAIDVLAPAWSAGILGRMPEIDGVIPSPFAHGEFDLAGRRRLAHELRATGYEQAIVLPNSWKSALVPFLANIPRRTGYVGEFRYGLLNDLRKLEKSVLPRLADRYRALADGVDRQSTQPRLMVDADAQQASLDRLGLNLDRPVLALCPGAEFGASKRWPAAHYAQVAQHYLRHDWDVWLFGSTRDQEVTATINTRLDNRARDLAGRTTLEEVVDLLACASAVVSNDSGLMHLAAAINVPLVAVYGSSDPDYTPPLSTKARVLRLELACSPCFKRECPLHHLDCLNQLGPETVLAALPCASSGQPGAISVAAVKS